MLSSECFNLPFHIDGAGSKAMLEAFSAGCSLLTEVWEGPSPRGVLSSFTRLKWRLPFFSPGVSQRASRMMLWRIQDQPSSNALLIRLWVFWKLPLLEVYTSDKVNVLFKEHKIERGRGSCFKNFYLHVSSQKWAHSSCKGGKVALPLDH